MNTLAYYETEADYQSNNYTTQMSIVQFIHKKKQKELRYKINANGSVVVVRDAQRIVVRHTEDHFIRISVIGGKGYEG